MSHLPAAVAICQFDLFRLRIVSKLEQVDVGLRNATDVRLIRLLQENGRQSISALGRELHLSRTAVQARLARLEREGVIQGYSVILRPEESEGVSAILALRFDLRPCTVVLEGIRTWPEIVQIYLVAGQVDALMVARVASPAAISDLSDRLRAVPGVSQVETTVILASFGLHASAPCP